MSLFSLGLSSSEYPELAHLPFLIANRSHLFHSGDDPWTSFQPGKWLFVEDERSGGDRQGLECLG